MMFKVETIEQFRILQFIKESFDLKWVQLELIDKYTIKVSDVYNDDIIFRFNVKSSKVEETTDEFVRF